MTVGTIYFRSNSKKIGPTYLQIQGWWIYQPRFDSRFQQQVPKATRFELNLQHCSELIIFIKFYE